MMPSCYHFKVDRLQIIVVVGGANNFYSLMNCFCADSSFYFEISNFVAAGHVIY